MTSNEIKKRIPTLATTTDVRIFLNEINKEIFGERYKPFQMRTLTAFCNPKRARNAYRVFKVKKKSGGERIISAPVARLKSIQTCLNEIFQTLYKPSSIATGFLPGKSVIENAQKHVGMNYVFNIDIKDFFPSVSKSRVWKVLQLRQYGFTYEAAHFISGLCCMKVVGDDGVEKYVLPQGAPTSPILTNMICESLDRKLAALAKKYHLKCSRYADDITFSSNHNIYSKDGDFMKELREIIHKQGFTLNEGKTRLQRRSQKQEVTGVVVNEKVNVSRRYVRDLQSILFIWDKYGYDEAFNKFEVYYGKNKPCATIRGELYLVRVIYGKLMYLKMVKGEDDPVYKRLRAIYDRNVGSVIPQEKPGPVLVQKIADFEESYGCDVTFARKEVGDTVKYYATSTFKGHGIYLSISGKCLNRLTEAFGLPDKEAKLKKKLFIVHTKRETKGSFWMVTAGDPRIPKITDSTSELLPLVPEELGDDGAVESCMPQELNGEQKITVEPVRNDHQDDGSNVLHNADEILKQLVENNFDLNILDQWDRTKNS